MGRWLEQKPNWLPYHPQVNDSGKPKGRPKDESLEYGVRYVPVKCPKCKSKDVTCYASRLPVRYHRCQKCGINFKSVEANEK